MYQRIMVPLNGSELAECALPHVAAITERGGVRDVFFVRVVEPFNLTSVRGEPAFTEEEIAQLDARSKAAAEQYLDELASRVSYGTAKVHQEVLLGRTAEGLVDYALNHKVDLIAIATHGRSGLSRWVWGSIADRVLRHAHVPVLMVRAPGHPAHKA